MKFLIFYYSYLNTKIINSTDVAQSLAKDKLRNRSDKVRNKQLDKSQPTKSEIVNKWTDSAVCSPQNQKLKMSKNNLYINKTNANEIKFQNKITKNRPLPRSKTLAKEDIIDFSIRKDVVNKTVLRCLRRYFSGIYRDCWQEFFDNKDHRSKWYFDSITL